MRKIYRKDLLQSVTASKGRFVSILTLMMLGSLALVGLKVASPNMERTAEDYLRKANTLDLAVIADYGLDKEDQDELKTLQGASVEFGYMADLTVENSEEAVRLYSKPESISTFQVTEGRLPEANEEIALADFWKDRYQIGETITFTKKEEKTVLKSQTFTITGFVQSGEILSKKDLGSASSGNGSLAGYGVILPSQFDTEVYSIARVRYDDLKNLDAFSSDYKTKRTQHQEELQDLLADNGQKRLVSIKTNGQKSLEEGKEQLQTAESNLENGRSQLEQAESRLKTQEEQATALPEPQKSQAKGQLTKAKEELATKKEKLAQTESDLTKEKEKLEQRQKDLDELAEPKYHVYNRQTMPGGQGYLMYSNASSSIRSVGNIFPVVLYMVAAMVTFTTMTRFVDEERTNAGIFKALGYRNRDIVVKFVLYGFLAGTVGTIIGILLGHYLLAGVISDVITAGMVVGKSQEYFYWSYSLIALALSWVSSVLPAYLVARRELHDEAAQLLLPKPPVKGSKILLERLSFIWSRLSFTHKVTARNIFRYKQRMLMTIFGVAGSVALLFAGLGIQSSVGGVVERQFEQIQQYQMIVAEKSSASEQEKTDLESALKAEPIHAYQKIYSKSIEKDFKGKAGLQTITMMVTNREDFKPFIALEENGREVQVTTDGAVVSQKLAQLAGVTVGDELELDGKEIKVAAISENYVGHFVYLNRATYEQVYGTSPQDNTYLVKLKDPTPSNTEKEAATFMEKAAVSGVVQNATAIHLFESVASSLNKTMAILVLVSVLLAIVILYNLTNINVAERIRELSTIKVLGFHNKEVTLYIYRETMVLSLVGIALGLVAGHYLHQFLIQMISPATILFYPRVSWEVYALPIVAVTVILALLGLFVNHHLRKVDMLEALKSVE
ncbi:FtsX-like permease family protein [Streptococcus oralis]|uniref:FtsX-like permease family protein n=1 Tax=Streptococcus oralis TaxID=1303 RepID=UPI000A0FD1C8|nr:FtsX-like permease family protein [Streptococcus oralis]MCY7091191.1 FtsX-like permease family protein [Streptococcus oralis]ORO48070.1 peptide ABC transporter permease [Streptococcus oralis subsp. tigurinus]